jgi:hypothetical protein
MRYIVFSSALILSFELLGTSIATATPVDHSAIVKAISNSREVIQVLDGCGHYRHRNSRGHCVDNSRKATTSSQASGGDGGGCRYHGIVGGCPHIYPGNEPLWRH